ncbi:MAG: hypothetical protein NVSMB58_26810 [Terriglobales bacterium]
MLSIEGPIDETAIEYSFHQRNQENMNESILKPWTTLYEAALLEFEPKKLIERINLAEVAINDRLHDLRLDSDHHEERQFMQDAQGALRFLRRSASNGS